MKSLKIGSIVNYVADDGKKIQPAIAVQVWAATCANFVVFRDGSNDNPSDRLGDALQVWKTSVSQAEPVEGEALAANTWHWPVEDAEEQAPTGPSGP